MILDKETKDDQIKLNNRISHLHQKLAAIVMEIPLYFFKQWMAHVSSMIVLLVVCAYVQ